MKVFMLYRPASDHERSVIEFQHDFQKRTQHKLEMISLDTVEGSEKAKLYGVVQYPAVVAVDDTGRMIKFWEGVLPLINELSFFTQD